MTRLWTAVLSAGLLLAGSAQALEKKPHQEEFYKAKRAAEEAAEHGEYLQAAKGLEAYVDKWGSKPVAVRETTDARIGIERYRGLASRWIMAKRKPAEHLKAFLRDMLKKPKGFHFGCSVAERARAFAFALEHDPWLKAQVAQAFPMGVKVQSPGRKASQADQEAFLEELARISKELQIPMRTDGDHWKLTLNLEVAGLGSTLPGVKMRSVKATGNCKLLDAAGETVTTFRASGTGIHMDETKGGLSASKKMAQNLLDKVVTHFLTKLSQRPG